MLDLLTIGVCAVFVGLGALHVYWAFGGRFGSQAAIPSTNGIAAFKPGRVGTLVVGALLALAAMSVAVSRSNAVGALPPWVTSGPAMVVAFVLAARSVGDFRMVGFFKKPNNSRFARLDTFCFSPLCLALAGAISVVALSA